jgi:hypothetical protein
MSYFCGILQEFEFENRKNSQTFIMLRKILWNWSSKFSLLIVNLYPMVGNLWM